MGRMICMLREKKACTRFRPPVDSRLISSGVDLAFVKLVVLSLAMLQWQRRQYRPQHAYLHSVAFAAERSVIWLRVRLRMLEE